VKVLLRYLELILSAAGIVVIFVVFLLFFHAQTTRWAAAIAASAVGVIHGLIFYFVRRQRQVRQTTINEMRLVVEDIVRNQMTVVSLSAALDPEASTLLKQREWAQSSIEAAHEIGRRLNDIDSERLSDLINRRPRPS
jgi:dipeptide/tripeptide permease